MKITRKQLKKMIYESLSGRKLERVAKRITYDIFEYLIDDDVRTAFKNQGSLGYFIETNLPEELTWLDNIVVRMHQYNNFNSTARYEYDMNASNEERKNSDLIIDLYMPKNYSIQQISNFRHDIESDIRHELEHSGQPTEDLMSLQSSISSEDDIWKNLNNAFLYYADRTEVPAYVSGWVLKSKRTGQNIENVINQELTKIYYTGISLGYSEEDMNEFTRSLASVYFDYYYNRWEK